MQIAHVSALYNMVDIMGLEGVTILMIAGIIRNLQFMGELIWGFVKLQKNLCRAISLRRFEAIWKDKDYLTILIIVIPINLTHC